ncbi:sensor histidine kinase protein [Rhizobium sp. N6212]|nr:sensor histidine kinase protein [Rhizobium sp. N6212]ANL22524.1 sensor histidine kinase protein [Rhizobium sp. N113]
MRLSWVPAAPARKYLPIAIHRPSTFACQFRGKGRHQKVASIEGQAHIAYHAGPGGARARTIMIGNRPAITRAKVGGKLVEIAIADSGIGMDADDLPKLFQPYYRARSATGIAGTGLGLNVVKQVVELHGGTVEVTSELGKGTTFTIFLPIEFLLSDQQVAA